MFHLKKEYMESLKKQLKYDLENNLSSNEKLETVFIGGGTPSTIKHEEYKEVFEILKPYISKDTEITTESNPNSATKQWLQGMKDLGVNRVSFGVQSFDDIKLKKLGRAHNSKGAITAIQNAFCIGFNSINCDIIYGVQGDTFESLKTDFETISSLPITHLSAYSLTLEEGTKFFNNTKIKIDDEELSYKVFTYLEKNGFKQYEISNFSKEKSFESKHNYGYWQHKEYLGVGAGAVGCIKKQRYYPKKDLYEYISNPLDYETENLSNDDIKVEKILLGLRCYNGFEINILNTKELERTKELIEEDKLVLKDEIVLNKNFLLSDEIALYILE
jgi:oxygen-independent coproporphyrinogen-3 oxidase